MWHRMRRSAAALLFIGTVATPVLADEGSSSADANATEELPAPVVATTPPTEAELRIAIEELDALDGRELGQRALQIMNAIHEQPDVQIQGQLSETLDQKLARLKDRGPLEGLSDPGDDVTEDPEEHASVEALLSARNGLVYTEEETRSRIEMLALDPKSPEEGLDQAMEIAGAIDRVDDPELQAALRRTLQERLDALQSEP